MQAFYEKPNHNHDFYCRNCTGASSSILGYRSHLHEHIELAMLFDGHTHATIDSTEYDVYGGDILIVFPNQIHDFRTIQKEKYVLLKLAPELISELRQFTTALPCSNVIRGGSSDPELRALIERITGIYGSEEPYKDAILHGYLLAFFGKLLQKMELRDVQSGDYHVVGLIMNYCSNNFRKNLSLSVLEKELHLNKYYISHILSNKLHIGFNDYINSLRISGACKYLLKSDHTITEISELVGFNTLRTFNRAFIKQMGCTPSEYRNKRKDMPHEVPSQKKSIYSNHIQEEL